MPCWVRTPRAVRRSRPPTTCAPSRSRRASRSARPRRRSGRRCWNRPRALADRVKAAEAQQAEADAAFTAAHMAISNVIVDGVPAGGEDDFAVLETVGEPPAHRRPEGPPRTRRVAGPDRHGARRQGVGVAVLLPHRRRRTAAARAAAARRAVGHRQRLHPDDPAGAGPPRGDGGHRVPRRPRRRGLPPRGRRHVPRRHLRGAAGRLPRRRDPRPVRRPAPLRRLVVVLPPRGGQLRQGHPRHHPGAPVRQGRGLRLLQARGGRGRTRAAARLAAPDARADRACPTG